MDRIFDRFYKVDTARARNVEGSGLGLSIVQKIVELHNGTVSVYSTKGEGTTVRVELQNRGKRLFGNGLFFCR